MQMYMFTYIYTFPIGAISLDNHDQYITFHHKEKHWKLKFKTKIFFKYFISSVEYLKANSQSLVFPVI